MAIVMTDKRTLWAAFAWVASAVVVELALLVAVIEVARADGTDAERNDIMVNRLVDAMCWTAVLFGVVFVLVWIRLRDDAPWERLVDRAVEDQVRYVSESAVLPLECDLSAHRALFAPLDGCTWIGRPRRDVALCHHTWHISTWKQICSCTMSFEGQGTDAVGVFRVIGCGNVLGPDGTVRLAWSQVYKDRYGDSGTGPRRVYEFRGVLASCPRDTAAIQGTWRRYSVDGADVRPGDIVRGEFVLVPGSRVRGQTTTTTSVPIAIR